MLIMMASTNLYRTEHIPHGSPSLPGGQATRTFTTCLCPHARTTLYTRTRAPRTHATRTKFCGGCIVSILLLINLSRLRFTAYGILALDRLRLRSTRCARVHAVQPFSPVFHTVRCVRREKAATPLNISLPRCSVRQFQTINLGPLCQRMRGLCRRIGLETEQGLSASRRPAAYCYLYQVGGTAGSVVLPAGRGSGHPGRSLMDLLAWWCTPSTRCAFRPVGGLHTSSLTTLPMPYRGFRFS